LTLGFAAGLGVPAALAAAVPLAAAATCVIVAASLPPVMTPPWALFTGAALAAALQAGLSTGLPGFTPARVLAPLPLGLAACAAALMLHQRDRGRRVEIMIDAALIVTAVSVAVLQWAPGVRLHGGGESFGIQAWTIAPVAAGAL